jgi:NAD(P)-dependent dehydrogenase (short-subunit alcohol dehydrogenase family)
MHDHAGRVALVTGGSSAIGAAVVRRLNASGARVASLDLSEINAPGAAVAVAGDPSRDVAAAVERVESELGPIEHFACPRLA